MGEQVRQKPLWSRWLRWQVPYTLPLLVFCVGLGLAFLAYLRAKKWQRTFNQNEVSRGARMYQQLLQREFDHNSAIINSIVALFRSSEKVTRAEFHRFVELPLSRQTEIQAVGWIPNVPRDLRNSYEKRARATGIGDFRITELLEQDEIVPAAQRPEYFPVYYLQPRGNNELTLGLDLASAPRLNAALKKARTKNCMVATGGISATQNATGQSRFYLISPVYQDVPSEQTGEEWGKSLRGFAVGVFRTAALVESAIKKHPFSDLEVWLRENSASAGEELLYVPESQRSLIAEEGRLNPPQSGRDFEEYLSLDVADRRWELIVRPTPAFLAAHWAWQAPLAFGITAAFSLLTAGLLALIGCSGEHHRKLAEQLETKNREIQRSKAKLSKSERKFRAIFHNANDAMYLHGLTEGDMPGSFLEVNQVACEMLGYSREELLEMSPQDVDADRDNGRLLDLLCEIREKEHVTSEMEHVAKDGTVIPVEVSSHLFEIRGRRLVLSIARDITGRKRAEEKMRKEKRLLEKVTDTSPVSITVVDKDGNITFANERAEEVLGLEKSKITGLAYNDPDWRIATLTGEPFPEEDLPFRQVMERGEPVYGVQHAIQLGEGPRKLLSINSAPLFDDSGSVSGVVSAIEDITQQKESEQQILRLNSLLRAIRNVNQVIVEVDDPQTLLQRTCRSLVETRQYKHVWAATFADEGGVQWAGQAGVGDAFEDLVARMNAGWKPMCVGRALSKPGVPFVIEPLRECEDCPLCGTYRGTTALKFGFGQNLELQGVLSLRLAEDHKIDEEEKSLVAEVAGDIGHGLRRVEAEEALERSETRYRRLFETAQDGMLILNADTGQIIDANPFIRDILGYSHEELVGKQLWQVGTFTDIAENKERFRHLAQQGYVRYEDLPLKAKDGEEVAVEFVSNTYEAGDTKVIQCNIRDITDRKRAEEVQERERRRAQRYLEVAAGIIVALDRGGNVTLINRAGRELLGYDEKEIVGKNWLEYCVPADWRETVKERHKQNVSSEIEGVNEFENPVVTASGEERYCIWKNTLLRDADGEIIGTLSSGMDITERKRAEDELRSARRQVIEQERQRALSIMASGIAHDFNNALSTIQGFTDLLLRSPEKLEDRETATGYLQHVYKAASNAAETVRRMRKFYRPHEDEPFQPVDLNSLVEEAVSMTRPRWKEQAQAKGVKIDVEKDLVDVPPVRGNEAELHEILTNLIFNAVDAMPEGGTLSVRTRGGEGEVLLQVTDTGTGMDEEEVEHCLDPFFTTKYETGTGLGLSTVRGIVERHEGAIEVESEEGKGTTFRIHLPADEEAEKKRPTPASEKETKPLRVLVAEDEKEQREMLKEYLRMDDHEVDTALNGREGLRMFKHNSYDLVITDRSMPEMGGDQFAGEVKKDAPGKPVIMLTGFGEMMKAADEKPETVDVLLSKPVTWGELRKAIGQVMHGHEK